ncbi:hypothetical protein CUMW_225040 [Citrus unshiu]|uniref:Uncharacterized protein n=1 Tax=Citrus unshiu TaxID=55188 RepID=A0A2H5QFG1_CITUN|nr:hypothetical protein CUMW_225040 [Citrus unshiu]
MWASISEALFSTSVHQNLPPLCSNKRQTFQGNGSSLLSVKMKIVRAWMVAWNKGKGLKNLLICESALVNGEYVYSY